MDLSTRYLGLELPHPLMPGASPPLGGDLDRVRRLEDAGAAAIVIHSLFQEQLEGEQLATHHHMETAAESHAEALSYMPRPPEFVLGPERYLDHLRKVKESVAVPVIASLNGTTLGGWLDYARLMGEAGADALELNVYQLPTDPAVSGADLEARIVDMVREVKNNVSVPVAIKLSPYHTALANFAQRLEEARIDGMILFNRFYQADIDVEELEAIPSLRLSDSSELLLRLRWLAVLSGNVNASLAASGGVHDAIDAIKAVMAGAHAVQMVSTLLKNEPEALRAIRDGMIAWMEAHEYDSLAQMRGSMDMRRCPDPGAFARANYMHILQSWKGFVG